MKPYALITGASGGIGREFALVLARHGYNLVLVARSEGKLHALADEVRPEGCEAMVIARDLTLPAASREIYDELKAAAIEIEVLINNAGFGDFGFFHETDWQKEETMINLNVMALTHLTKLFGTDMVARGQGRILNVASTAAFQPGPLMSVYYATKHFVLAFSEGIANEWKNLGVTVTALCPGPTESGFQQASEMEDSGLVKDQELASAREVAEYGYRALIGEKTVAVPGLMNQLLAFSVRFLPRSTVRRLVRKIQEEK